MADYLGKLNTGEKVFEVNNRTSYVQPEVKDLLQELFQKIDSEKRDFICQEVNFERVIGKTICLEISEHDNVVYAQRVGKKGLTRFVKDREPVDSTKAVIILKLHRESGNYTLITAFVGGLAEPEVWDRNATPNSKPFWENHALLLDGSYEIIPETETKTCPW